MSFEAILGSTKEEGLLSNTKSTVITNEILPGIQNEKHVIFDLDGTLFDSMGVGQELINTLSCLGYDKITKDNIESLRGMDKKQAMKELGMKRYHGLPLLLKRGSYLKKHIDKIVPFEGIHEKLEVLRKHDRVLDIVSSSKLGIIKDLLEKHDLKGFFNGTYAASLIRPHAKTRILQGLIKKYKTTGENMIYVTDELRDIDALDRLYKRTKQRIKAVGVTHGFNNEMALRGRGIKDFIM